MIPRALLIVVLSLAAFARAEWVPAFRGAIHTGLPKGVAAAADADYDPKAPAIQAEAKARFLRGIAGGKYGARAGEPGGLTVTPRRLADGGANPGPSAAPTWKSALAPDCSPWEELFAEIESSTLFFIIIFIAPRTRDSL